MSVWTAPPLLQWGRAAPRHEKCSWACLPHQAELMHHTRAKRSKQCAQSLAGVRRAVYVESLMNFKVRLSVASVDTGSWWIFHLILLLHCSAVLGLLIFHRANCVPIRYDLFFCFIIFAFSTLGVSVWYSYFVHPGGLCSICRSVCVCMFSTRGSVSFSSPKTCC